MSKIKTLFRQLKSPKEILLKFTKIFSVKDNDQDPKSTWERKVLERKLKTDEAKKAWEEKRQKSVNNLSEIITSSKVTVKRGEVSLKENNLDVEISNNENNLEEESLNKNNQIE